MKSERQLYNFDSGDFPAFHFISRKIPECAEKLQVYINKLNSDIMYLQVSFLDNYVIMVCVIIHNRQKASTRPTQIVLLPQVTYLQVQVYQNLLMYTYNFPVHSRAFYSWKLYDKNL